MKRKKEEKIRKPVVLCVSFLVVQYIEENVIFYHHFRFSIHICLIYRDLCNAQQQQRKQWDKKKERSALVCRWITANELRRVKKTSTNVNWSDFGTNLNVLPVHEWYAVDTVKWMWLARYQAIFPLKLIIVSHWCESNYEPGIWAREKLHCSII